MTANTFKFTLRRDKTCGCGKVHFLISEGNTDEFGNFYWNCECGSTLMDPNPAYMKLLRDRAAVKQWVKEAMEELGIIPQNQMQLRA